jgi:hypothetical protein
MAAPGARARRVAAEKSPRRKPVARALGNYERFSRIVNLTFFAAAAIVVVLAPLWAISWSHLPFPGFMVEQTMVVNYNYGSGWSGRAAGLEWPMRVTRIGGEAVTSPADFRAVLARHQPGEEVAVLVDLPDGPERLFPAVLLQEFTFGDMVRLFLLPYAVGLAYLAVAVWIYRAKGDTRSGRALAYFSVNTALVSLLTFDLSTSHVAPALWTIAFAQIPGALIGLALRFPVSWKPVERRAWLLSVPYTASVGLAIWGEVLLGDTTRPWAYANAWNASYGYTALAGLAFVGVTIYRARSSGSELVRRQARVVLWGSTIAFLPMSLWFAARLFGLNIAFNPEIFFPWLLVFPVSVSVAILRYRLMDADVLVNRTLVYGILTAFVAGVFTAALGVAQRLFVAFTGEKSDAAIVITTLLVASAFAPVKKRVERAVAARFGEPPDTTLDLRAFGEEVRAFTRMSEAKRIAEKLLEEAMDSLGAASGAVRLVHDGHLQPLQTYGKWTGEAWLSVPLEEDGIRNGLLFLGPRANGQPYTHQEFDALREVATEVSRAVRLARGPDPLENGPSKLGSPDPLAR